jgi:putative selenate reductase
MRPIPFLKLLGQAMTEYKQKGSMFYVPFAKIEPVATKVLIGGKPVESPIGPAAGPHTQLAQNIIAAYAGGARCFELKTVQIMHGEDLGIIKPCIYVNGEEAYNTEWSTELTLEQALEEYVKAWCALKLLIKEFDLGDEDGFVFNISVGYSLEGIQSVRLDYFLESMKDASSTDIFQACLVDAISYLTDFEQVTKEYIIEIDPQICDTVTLSTMHGCPVGEIESIVAHLLVNKRLNTYLKCNPTLLGQNEITAVFHNMGYEYLTFPEAMFQEDLGFNEAVALIRRLMLLAKEQELEFGVKLTNTFPVHNLGQELAGEMMYMSGPSLYPLAIGVAAKLADALGEELRISYSGGADIHNIKEIYDTGIYPITVSTYLLKPGGYKNLNKLNKAIQGVEAKKVLDLQSLKSLAALAGADKNYYKKQPNKKHKERKPGDALLCTRCNNCIDTCPNRANIPVQADEKKYILHLDALCNECGNCAIFCPSGYLPYKEKFTIFTDEADFHESDNPGISITERQLLRFEGKVFESEEETTTIPDDLLRIKEILRGNTFEEVRHCTL